jgi:hypothetical protein
MAALREKVRQNWLSSQGFHAPRAGMPFRTGPQSSAEVNAQEPNRKRKKPLVRKRRKPRFLAF